MKVCLVAFYSGYGDNPATRLSDLLNIFRPIAEETYVITGEIASAAGLKAGAHLVHVKYSSDSPRMLARVLRQLMVQLTVSWHLLRISRKIDLIFWGVSAHSLIVPMVLAKLMRKKTILFLAFRTSEMLTRLFGFQGAILPRVYRALEAASYSLCHTIVVNSIDLLEQPQLKRHKAKAYPVASPARFIDTSLFNISKPLRQRAKQIGYVGRLSEEKGVVNLVKAIPLMLREQGDLEFTIIGDGPQKEELEKIIRENSLSQKVTLIGWVNHGELPEYLNEMRLLVLPSFTEGLPTIALEAMACGTPVLATSVGGVPELIKDGETGFILKDNSPQTIAQGILAVSNYANIDEIVKNAHHLIEMEYTYEATVARFRGIATTVTGEGSNISPRE